MSEPATRTIKLIIEYDGTGLCGWQRQENGPSVQAYLEAAVEKMVGAPTAVIGASRTDAGVHAAGQVAHFHTTRDIPTHGFRCGLSVLCPEAVTVVAASDEKPSFHARFCALGKRYRYTVAARPSPSPLVSRYAWMRKRPLDVEAMTEAARALVGEHDFSAFRAAGCQALSPVREITAIRIIAASSRGGAREPALVHIEVCGTGFLRNMVRIIAGTLVEVGEHRRDIAEVKGALASRDRRRAGQTAPACGLTLMDVWYPEDGGL
ncbi:MAG TPA: tRNA pseudouridine(38-40) synthase TruA [Kofleriaceae bacterium]|nr:tRNA pseudouridine(38-40) synthase TruA [Kofleriaceae bacterium]